MARKATKKPASKAKSTKASTPKKSSAPLKRHRPTESPQPASPGLLDENTKRTITGVSFIVLAVVFFLLVILPANGAIISTYASEWIHLIFGVGAYMFPLVLVGIGISFLQKTNTKHISARTAVGLSIFFVSLLGLIAVFTPISSLGMDDLNLLFASSSLISYGGYIGAGLAYALMSLLGRLIAGVIFVGFMIIGVVVVGFSVSKTLGAMRAKKRQLEEKYANEDSIPFSGARLRMRKADDVAMDNIQQAKLLLGNPEGASRAEALSTQLTRPLGDGQEVFHPLPNLSRVLDDESDLPSSAHEAQVIEDPSAYARLDERVPQVIKPAAEQPLIQQPHTQPQPHQGMQPHFQQHMQPARPIQPQQPMQPMQPQQPAVPLPGATTQPIPQPQPQLNVPLGAPLPENIALTVGENSIQTSIPVEKPQVQPEKTKTPTPKKKNPPKKVAPGATRDGFTLPSMMLLEQPTETKQKNANNAELQQTAAVLQQTLENFGIKASVVGWIEGPTVTLFKVDLPSGVRVSRITNLNDDIALALASPGVRIFAPIPGTNHVGIEIPNQSRQTVLLSEVLQHAQDGPLELAIGKDVEGRAIISDLAKMPHLLIGGTTGSGKSVSINAMIMSILMRCTPSEVRSDICFVLVF